MLKKAPIALPVGSDMDARDNIIIVLYYVHYLTEYALCPSCVIQAALVAALCCPCRVLGLTRSAPP